MRLLRWILLVLLAMGTAALAQQGAVPPLPPITEPASGERLPGKFIWADLFSSDVETSRKFYEQVFGWEWRQIKQPPQPYGIFYLDDVPVAGLAYREAPDGGDAYGRWIHYISVEDVNLTEDAISRRGGHVLLNTRTFADRGDFAILRDIHDAPFGIIHSSSGDPGDYRAAFGEWIWRELFTRDLGESIRFYTELFAYESEADGRNPEIMQYLLKSHGYLRAGIGALSPGTDTAPTWLGYIRVEDIDAAVKRTLAHGGKLLLEPKAEIADGGLAIVTDPTGATIGLLRWDYADDEQQEMQQ
jgi:predicted enzyme related to lactoylglutathione lyase